MEDYMKGRWVLQDQLILEKKKTHLKIKTINSFQSSINQTPTKEIYEYMLSCVQLL